MVVSCKDLFLCKKKLKYLTTILSWRPRPSAGRPLYRSAEFNMALVSMDGHSLTRSPAYFYTGSVQVKLYLPITCSSVPLRLYICVFPLYFFYRRDCIHAHFILRKKKLFVICHIPTILSHK